MLQQQSPRAEAYPKQKHVIENDVSGEVTPFINILDILFSQLLHTPEEASIIVSTSDLYFFFNLLEKDSMELALSLLTTE